MLREPFAYTVDSIFRGFRELARDAYDVCVRLCSIAVMEFSLRELFTLKGNRWFSFRNNTGSATVSRPYCDRAITFSAVESQINYNYRYTNN